MEVIFRSETQRMRKGVLRRVSREKVGQMETRQAPGLKNPSVIAQRQKIG